MSLTSTNKQSVGMQTHDPFDGNEWNGLVRGDKLLVVGLPGPCKFHKFESDKNRLIVIDRYGIYHKVALERIIDEP